MWLPFFNSSLDIVAKSYLWREDTADRYIFFNDKEYTDVQYMGEYPTIHHLISDLMHDKINMM